MIVYFTLFPIKIQSIFEKYPNDLFYKVKIAQSLDEKGEYDESLELLRGQLEDYPDNPDVTGAYAASSEMYALDLIRDNDPEAAVAVVDSALVFDTVVIAIGQGVALP